MTEPVPQPKPKRGFAAMSPERRREIGRLGGDAAHHLGHAHRFTSEEAREAGSKGGRTTQALGIAPKFTSERAREAGRRGGEAVSRDREHMARIGRRGGERRKGVAQGVPATPAPAKAKPPKPYQPRVGTHATPARTAMNGIICMEHTKNGWLLTLRCGHTTVTAIEPADQALVLCSKCARKIADRAVRDVDG